MALTRLRVLPQILPIDGRDVEIRNNGTYIQWRYSSDHHGDYEWQNIVAISALIGPAGPAIELRTDGTYIQYRVVGSGEDGWIDVVPLDDLKGPQGDQGPAATVAIGAVTTLLPGNAATVVNTGTANDAVFDFGIPASETGIYATRDGLPSVVVPVAFAAIRLNGIAASDDAKGGIYAYRATEPVHSGKAQDADGKWFERVTADLPYSTLQTSTIFSPASYYQETGIFPPSGGNHLTTILSPGAVTTLGAYNRTSGFGVRNYTKAISIDRSEAFGDGALRLMRYGERNFMAGSIAGEQLGAGDVSEHEFWINAGGFVPGDVGWNYGGLETDNPGIGLTIAAWLATDPFAKVTTDVARNVGAGRDSFNGSIISVDSVGIGYRTLASGLSISWMTAVGTDAYRNALFVTNGVAIGGLASTKQQTGTRDTSVGYQALTGMVTGDRVTGVGAFAGSGFTAISDSVLLGHGAGNGMGITVATGILAISIQNGAPLISGNFLSSGGTYAGPNVGINIAPANIKGTFHVRSADSGVASVASNANDVIIENSSNVGISFLTPNNAQAGIYFSDPEDNNVGALIYDHLTNTWTVRAGDQNRVSVITGMLIGAPTGGDKGVGTLNAVAVYDDNTLLTCYVMEAANNNAIDLDFWDKVSATGKHEAAHRFASERMEMLDVDRFTAFWREHGHLSSLPGRDQWKDHAKDAWSTGQMIQALWETVELQAVHIAQLRDDMNAPRPTLSLAA